MTSITATLLTLPTAIVLGHSVQGRPIEAVHVGGGSGPVVLVVGCIHGDECAALPVIAALRRSHPSGEDLWVIPEANPDGYAHHTRTNAHGVDLNRDFGMKRELETRALVAFIRRIKPRVTVWFHQHQDCVRGWGASAVRAKLYARRAGMAFCHLAWPSGSATSWQNGLGESSFVVELPAGSLGPDAVQRQVRAVLGLFDLTG